MSDRFLIQTAAAHLTVAMRLLDRADLLIPAAHVDAALNSLVSEIGEIKRADVWSENNDNSMLDRIIEEIYVLKNRDVGSSMDE